MGPYIKTRMIGAFTKHLGHYHAGLLQGTGNTECNNENADPVLDPLMLMTANTNIGRVTLEEDGDTIKNLNDYSDNSDSDYDDINAD